MNFAPYQDDAPESTRSNSPAPPKPEPQRTGTSYFSQLHHQPYGAQQSDRLPSPEDFEHNVGVNQPQGRGFGNGVGADERNVDLFSTSLPMRLDYEACLAYLLLPPAGGALLLMLEHKSDYVRFHAWQSSLVFTLLFIVHLIFSFSKFISYTLLIFDIILIAWLTLHAYRDAQTLERCEVPYFGRLASSFVDEE